MPCDYQIIPDRTVENKQGHEFARALHDLHRPWVKRASLRERKIEPNERVWYVIRLTSKEITFHIHMSEASRTFVKQRLNRYWPRTTVQEKELSPIPVVHTATAEMKYRRHNIFALSADWREDTVPIAGILNVVRDMKGGDEARVVICVEPYSRTAWSDFSERAHTEFKAGKTPTRRGLVGKIGWKQAAVMVDGVMESISDVAETLFESPEEAKARDRRKKNKADLEKREIMQDGRLSRETLQKRNEPTFKTHIYITSTSEDLSRRRITLLGLSNAFSELSGDNELRRIDRGRNTPRIIAMLNRWSIPFEVDANIMSVSEVGKLFQVPTASLQDEYAEQLQTVAHRETDLSKRLLDANGLYMGEVTHKGVTHRVYFPTSDRDELCLPRIVIGGMGQGKTQGIGATFATECIKQGFSVFTIDAAKGELGDQIEGWCKRNGRGDKIKRIRFGDKPVGLDWCEIGESKRIANQFSQEVLSFFDRQGADPGIETKRYIRLAAKTTASVGGSSLVDVVKLFTDKTHLQGTVKQLFQTGRDDLAAEWDPFVNLSDGMKGKVLEPVLNRLDILLGDDYLNACMRSTNSIDLRKWINGGYAVILDVPKDELGDDATDVLCAMLIAKVWLATLSRKEANATPAFLVMDEPHVYLSSAKHWRSMVVESRKWRLGLMWMFHAWEQIPKELAEIIKAAGPHYTLYQPSKRTFQSLAEESAPWTLEEALKIPRHHAINIWRTGGKIETPFLAHMPKPPLTK